VRRDASTKWLLSPQPSGHIEQTLDRHIPLG
jgi:hypothetical protein